MTINNLVNVVILYPSFYAILKFICDHKYKCEIVLVIKLHDFETSSSKSTERWLYDRVVGGWSKILVVRTKYGDGQAFLRYGWDMATINCSTCHFSPVCGWSSGKTSGECHFWKALCSAGEVLAVGRIAHTIFLIYFFNTSTGREMEELFFISSHLLLGENWVAFHFPPPSAGGKWI